MKRLLLLFLLLCGCDSPIPPRETPTVNLPASLRQSNYDGGSCGHAALISLLRWQNKSELAAYWRRTYSGGVSSDEMPGYLDRANIPYAQTFNEKNVAFLEWACRTRRGTVVSCHGGRHAVCLVYLDSKVAGILDNNETEKIKWISRQQFLDDWFDSYSWAFTPVFSPVPPK